MPILDYFRCWCCKKEPEEPKRRIIVREYIHESFSTMENVPSVNSLNERPDPIDIHQSVKRVTQ